MERETCKFCGERFYTLDGLHVCKDLNHYKALLCDICGVEHTCDILNMNPKELDDLTGTQKRCLLHLVDFIESEIAGLMFWERRYKYSSERDVYTFAVIDDKFNLIQQLDFRFYGNMQMQIRTDVINDYWVDIEAYDYSVRHFWIAFLSWNLEGN